MKLFFDNKLDVCGQKRTNCLTLLFTSNMWGKNLRLEIYKLDQTHRAFATLPVEGRANTQPAGMGAFEVATNETKFGCMVTSSSRQAEMEVYMVIISDKPVVMSGILGG